MKCYRNIINDNVFICGIVLISSLRLTVFILVFPFFNNVDEVLHFDAIVKLSKFELPSKGDELFVKESAELVAHNFSPEYLGRYSVTPLENLPQNSALNEAKRSVQHWMTLENNETHSPPLYYLLAGGYYQLGKTFGLVGRTLLYWTRLLNVLIYAITLLISFQFLKQIFGRSEIVYGTLIFLAFFPQDVFYGLNSDVMSPLVFSLVLFYGYRLYYNSDYRFTNYIFFGVASALTFLTKLSNIVVLVYFITYTVLLIVQLVKSRKLRDQLPRIISSVIICFTPITSWMIWNLNNVGDLLATTDKIKKLDWTTKPTIEYFTHPIFSFEGLFYFLHENIKTYWRGELTWGMERMVSPISDYYFLITTYMFFILLAWKLLRSKAQIKFNQNKILLQGLYIITLYICLEFFLSVRYDFGSCWYPSQQLPYFTSGRLLLGSLIPFALIYVTGLGYVIKFFCPPLPLPVIMFLIGIFITIGEVISRIDAFFSPFNWFNS